MTYILRYSSWKESIKRCVTYQIDQRVDSDTSFWMKPQVGECLTKSLWLWKVNKSNRLFLPWVECSRKKNLYPVSFRTCLSKTVLVQSSEHKNVQMCHQYLCWVSFARMLQPLLPGAYRWYWKRPSHLSIVTIMDILFGVWQKTGGWCQSCTLLVIGVILHAYKCHQLCLDLYQIIIVCLDSTLSSFLVWTW